MSARDRLVVMQASFSQFVQFAGRKLSGILAKNVFAF
jgi:hypothetical protein